MSKKRKCKHSSEKENTPAWQSQQSGTEFLSQVTDEDREVLRVLKEDESHRSFEMMTERWLKEVVPNARRNAAGSCATAVRLNAELKLREGRKLCHVNFTPYYLLSHHCRLCHWHLAPTLPYLIVKSIARYYLSGYPSRFHCCRLITETYTLVDPL